DRRAVTRHQMTPLTAASPVSRSVPGFKRDDDVRCFRLVKLETSRVVVARNHGVVVGNGPGFELPQSALDLCGREFHCTLLSIGSPQGDEPCDIALCGASHLEWSNVKLGHPAA